MKKIIFAFLVPYIISCTDTNSSKNIASVDFGYSNDYKYSEVFDTLEIVPLSTEELIGKIDDLIISDDFIFVLDRTLAKSVYIYDRSGNLLNVIKPRGLGPTEFSTPRNIYFDVKQKLLFIHGSLTNKILIYDVKGQFLKEFKIKLSTIFADFTSFDDGFLLMNPGASTDSERLIFLDSQMNFGNFLSNLKVDENRLKTDGGRSRYFFNSVSGSEIHFLDFISNSIVTIPENTSNSTIIDVNFPDHNFPIKNELQRISDLEKEIKANDLFFIYNNLLDIGDYFVFNVNMGFSTIRMVFLEKESNRTFPINHLQNDMDMVAEISSIPGQYNNSPGKFITAYESNFLKSRLSQMELNVNPYGSILSKFSIEDYDNPLLFIYSFKRNLKFLE